MSIALRDIHQLLYKNLLLFTLQENSDVKSPLVAVSVAWLTFACTFGLTQAVPVVLSSRPAAAVLSAATVAASSVAVLSFGTTHTIYALVPVLVATHSMVPTHVAVACFATAAVMVTYIMLLLTESCWRTPSAHLVKQVCIVAA